MEYNNENKRSNHLIKLLSLPIVMSIVILVFLLTIPTHEVHVLEVTGKHNTYYGYHPADDCVVYSVEDKWYPYKDYNLSNIKRIITSSEYWKYWYFKQAAKLKENMREYLEKGFIAVAILGSIFFLIGLKALMKWHLMPLVVGALALYLSWLMYYFAKIGRQIDQFEELIPDPRIFINPYVISIVAAICLLGFIFIKPIITKHLPKRIRNWWKNWFRPMEEDQEKRDEVDINTANIKRIKYNLEKLIAKYRNTEYDVFGLYHNRSNKNHSNYEAAIVPIDEHIRHGWVTGGPGSGKTSSANTMRIYQSAQREKNCLILTYKPDEQYISACYHIAQKFGFKFIFITTREGETYKGKPWQSNTINPLAGGTAKSRTDRLFQAFEFDKVAGDGSYYIDVQKEACELIITDFLKHDIEPTFSRLLDAVRDPAYLQNVIPDFNKNTPIALKRLSTKLSDLSGIKCLNDPTPDFSLDMFDSTKKIMVYLEFDAMAYPLAARTCGRMLYSDLLGWASRRKDARVPLLCAFDEFQEAANDALRQLLGGGRGRGLELWISCQSVSDLAIKELGGREFVQRIWDVTETKIIFRPKNGTDAKMIADCSGTERFTDYVTRLDDSTNGETGEMKARLKGKQLEGFAHKAEKPLLHPNLLMNLPKFCAAFFTPDNAHLPWIVSLSHLWDMDFQLDLEAQGPPPVETTPTSKSEAERFKEYLANHRADNPEVLF